MKVAGQPGLLALALLVGAQLLAGTVASEVDGFRGVAARGSPEQATKSTASNSAEDDSGPQVPDMEDVDFISVKPSRVGEPLIPELTPGNAGSPPLDPAVCMDGKYTGVRFRNGTKARCPDLRTYCDHPTLHKRVTKVCRQSCGECELEETVRNPCTDLVSSEHPKYQIAGRLATCDDLKMFCHSHQAIRDKCRMTCGQCGLETLEFKTTAAPSTTWLSEAELARRMGAGCMRRRRFGYCETRRRRFT